MTQSQATVSKESLMKSQEIREKFIAFFKDKSHAVILSASLIPENDPSLLFTTAGMHPLVPFLLNGKHPKGQRLVDVQKCLRTDDIDEVGDTYHHTFFEMLGNWSIGDPDSKDGIGENGYWKKESIEWSYEFLTSKKWLGINKDKIAISVFKGDEDAPFDEESYKIWRELGIPEEKIVKLPKKNNWWGQVLGPCGPNTEIFYWSGEGDAPEKFDHEDTRWIELWNNVFMEFNRKVKAKNEQGEPTDFDFEPLKQKNVDTGMGLERINFIINGHSDDYETDLFAPIIEKIEELSGKEYEENHTAMRIIADHVKAATFIFADGVEPANIGRGYILRRLLRRAIRYSWMLDVKDSLLPIAETTIEIYKDVYPELTSQSLGDKFKKEEEKFQRAINQGLKKANQIFGAKTPIPHEEFAKIMQLEHKGDVLGKIYANPPSEEIDDNFQKAGIKINNDQIHQAYVSGQEAFNLYQTNGFPIEMIVEMAQEANLFVDINGFKAELAKHQDLSRTAAAGMFKGGLADSSEETIKLHTAAHLLLAALQQVLVGEVVQKGSNITAERLRFDFSHLQKLTDEEIKKVEELINQKIKEAIPVTMEEISLDEAKKSGAHGTFSDRYGDRVKVYTVGDFSKEICGGPHVKNTSELGHFKIIKEEASSAGVRRIKATLK